MKLFPSTAFAILLLLCACSADGSDQAGSADVPRGSAAAPATPGSGNGQPPAQQPGGAPPAAEPVTDVTFTVSPETTREDSTVSLALRNGSEERVGYNLCTSALETSGGSEVPTSRVCTMELRTLEPGRTATYRYELPVNMVLGSYRFATQVNLLESSRTRHVRSNAFVVRPD